MGSVCSILHPARSKPRLCANETHTYCTNNSVSTHPYLIKQPSNHHTHTQTNLSCTDFTDKQYEEFFRLNINPIINMISDSFMKKKNVICQEETSAPQRYKQTLKE